VSGRGNPEDGTFSLPGVPLYPGTNVLVARLRDVSGNEAEQTRKVVRTNALETFEYDGKGNLANWVSWVQNWSYERDWADRLVKVESRPGTPQGSWRRVEWQYDALGRRIRQTTSTWLVQSNLWVVTEDLKFLSDPLLFGRHLVDLDASNNVPVRTYVWGLDLSERMDGAGGVVGLLWVTLHTASGPAAGTHFAAYDGNGNVVALSAATDGSPTARYEYGPFGESIRLSGPAAPLNPFRFSTKRTDNTTDLVLYEYRAYSPIIGRWLSRDPVEAIRVGFVAGQARGRAKAQASGAGLRLSVHREGCPECFSQRTNQIIGTASMSLRPHELASTSHWLENDPVHNHDAYGLQVSSGFACDEDYLKALRWICYCWPPSRTTTIVGACTTCERLCESWCYEKYYLDDELSKPEFVLCMRECSTRKIRCVSSGCRLRFN